MYIYISISIYICIYIYIYIYKVESRRRPAEMRWLMGFPPVSLVVAFTRFTSMPP